MNKFLTTLIATITLTLSANVLAEQSCPSFTDEQQHLLRVAYVYGNQPNPDLHDAIGDTIGYTLAAIIWKESFVGNYIIRFNSGDGNYGSYGVGHVQLSTVMFMDGHETTWRNRDRLAPDYITRLINDDNYAINTSYRYLSRMMIRNGFWLGVKAYNGAGRKAQEYMMDVQQRTYTLIRCGI